MLQDCGTAAGSAETAESLYDFYLFCSPSVSSQSTCLATKPTELTFELGSVKHHIKSCSKTRVYPASRIPVTALLFSHPLQSRHSLAQRRLLTFRTPTQVTAQARPHFYQMKLPHTSDIFFSNRLGIWILKAVQQHAKAVVPQFTAARRGRALLFLAFTAPVSIRAVLPAQLDSMGTV